MTSMSAVLLARPLPPPRASQVHPRLPAWLLPALRDAYPELAAPRVTAGEMLSRLERQIGCSVFNHYGTDPDGNFCSEPYARSCRVCQTAAREFAQRLGVRLEVSDSTFHAAHIAECVRFTFHRP